MRKQRSRLDNLPDVVSSPSRKAFGENKNDHFLKTISDVVRENKRVHRNLLRRPHGLHHQLLYHQIEGTGVEAKLLIPQVTRSQIDIHVRRYGSHNITASNVHTSGSEHARKSRGRSHQSGRLGNSLVLHLYSVCFRYSLGGIRILAR